MQSISTATAASRASVTTPSAAHTACPAQTGSADARRAVVRPGILASVTAAAATTAAAAITTSGGVSFTDRTGSAAIPTLAFTTLTLLFSLIGVGLAAMLAQRARRPRSTFVRITVTLVALSFVPDLASGFNATATVTLILIHLLAAAIVVPTLAARLARAR